MAAPDGAPTNLQMIDNSNDDSTVQGQERAQTDDSERDNPEGQLDALDEVLELHSYPTTTQELIDAFGDHEVETQDGWSSLEEVLDPIDNQTYESADDARRRILERVNR